MHSGETDIVLCATCITCSVLAEVYSCTCIYVYRQKSMHVQNYFGGCGPMFNISIIGASSMSVYNNLLKSLRPHNCFLFPAHIKIQRWSFTPLNFYDVHVHNLVYTCVMSSSITCAMLCQQFIACRDRQEASLPCTKINDESVVMLDLYTFRVEKKPSLSRLAVESSPGSEEGSNVRQMVSELLNEEFSGKARR